MLLFIVICRCFLRLFLWVNQSKEKLKPTQPEDAPVTHDLDLVGLEYLWQIVFCSPVEPIIDQSINILREIYTCLSDLLQEDVVGIRQRFIDKCVEFLEKTLDLGGLKWIETSDSSSVASCSMVEGSSEVTDKQEEKDAVSSISTGEYRMLETQSLVAESASLPIGEVRQVENCLRILRVSTHVQNCNNRLYKILNFFHGSFFVDLYYQV